MSVTRGTTAEDLVYLGWFAGAWDCAAQLLRAEPGAGGPAALDAALPGAAAALAEMAAARGTEMGQRLAVCRWKPTDPASNGISPGFALEEAGGVCAGVVAAAAAVAGPRASVRVVSTFEDVWEATGAVGKRSLAAVGSSGLPGADGPGSFRVSELFEVAVPPSGTYSKPPPPRALARVVTTYRQAPAAGAGPAVFEALQTVVLLAAPAAPGGSPGSEALATFTSLLVYKARRQ